MSSAGKSICTTVCMQTNPIFSFQNRKEHKSEDFIHVVHSWLDTSQCKVRKYVGSWWFWRVISLTRENIFIPNQKWISIRSLYYHICVICPCCLLHRSVTASDPSVVPPYRLPPGQYSKLFSITNLRELPPQSDPLWLTNPLPSPPAAPAIISPDYPFCHLCPSCSLWTANPRRARARPPAEQRLTVCKPVKNSQWGPRELIQAADDDMDFTFHARCSDWQLSGY